MTRSRSDDGKGVVKMRTKVTTMQRLHAITALILGGISCYGIATHAWLLVVVASGLFIVNLVFAVADREP